ncbi:MAG: hypothetical protein J6D00_02295 [Christensenellaceae bacterium]|nr:hypothetical protein [Clostridia bacterium]MBP3940310.1 hypothetical protein [Christensenellaceae bacterium]
MKLCCDICGGPLIIGAGGQSAACKNCGMEHSIERLREKLGIESPVEAVEPAKKEEPAAKVEPIVKEEPVVRVAPVADAEDVEIPASVVVIADDNEENIPIADYELIEDDSRNVVTPPSAHVSYAKKAVYNPEAEVYITSPHLHTLPEAYFESLLVYLYPQFDIYKDVTLAKGIKADFMFTKNGKKVLAIVFCHGNEYGSVQTEAVINYCRNHGIAVLRFFRNFANKPAYVKDRIDSINAIRKA